MKDLIEIAADQVLHRTEGLARQGIRMLHPEIGIDHIDPKRGLIQKRLELTRANGTLRVCLAAHRLQIERGAYTRCKFSRTERFRNVVIRPPGNTIDASFFPGARREDDDR